MACKRLEASGINLQTCWEKETCDAVFAPLAERRLKWTLKEDKTIPVKLSVPCNTVNYAYSTIYSIRSTLKQQLLMVKEMLESLETVLSKLAAQQWFSGKNVDNH